MVEETNDEWEAFTARRRDKKREVIYVKSNKKQKITNCTWVGLGLASRALIKKYKKQATLKKKKEENVRISKKLIRSSCVFT